MFLYIIAHYVFNKSSLEKQIGVTVYIFHVSYAYLHFERRNNLKHVLQNKVDLFTLSFLAHVVVVVSVAKVDLMH